MKEYPTIPRDIQYGRPIYAFDKIDGSNIRAEWTRKKGRFFKYGSRTVLIDRGHPFLGESIDHVQNKYEDALAAIFEKKRWHKALAFFEFHGPKSFAGFHEEDDDHTVTLIDVKPYKHGILNPDEFLDLFGHLEVPELVYRGNMNKEVEQEIRQGRMPGITFEGAVCKGKAKGKTAHPMMFKVKSYAWLDKLKEFCGDNMKQYRMLV